MIIICIFLSNIECHVNLDLPLPCWQKRLIVFKCTTVLILWTLFGLFTHIYIRLLRDLNRYFCNFFFQQFKLFIFQIFIYKTSLQKNHTNWKLLRRLIWINKIDDYGASRKDYSNDYLIDWSNSFGFKWHFA